MASGQHATPSPGPAVLVLDEHRGAIASELRALLGTDDELAAGPRIAAARDRAQLIAEARANRPDLILVAADRLGPEAALAQELSRPGAAPWACLTDRSSVLALAAPWPTGGVGPRALIERPIDGPALAEVVRALLWAERALATEPDAPIGVAPRGRGVVVARRALAHTFLERTLVNTGLPGGIVLERIGGARRLITARGLTPMAARELELAARPGPRGWVPAPRADAEGFVGIDVSAGPTGLFVLLARPTPSGQASPPRQLPTSEDAAADEGTTIVAAMRALEELPAPPTLDRDRLTGLVGRGALLGGLDAAIARARADGGAGPALVVVSLDLRDPVERIRRLGKLATHLPVLLRATDLPARIGPSALAALLPAVGSDGARAATIRIERALGPLGFGATGTPVSLGAASWPAHGRAATELVAAAERAILGR